MKRNPIFYTVVLAVLLALQSCTPLAPLDTMNKRLLAAHETYAGVLQTAIDLRKAGLINDALKGKIDNVFKDVDKLFDTANLALSVGDVEKLDLSLRSINTVLLKTLQTLREVQP